jgi:hypothetical protein
MVNHVLPEFWHGQKSSTPGAADTRCIDRVLNVANWRVFLSFKEAAAKGREGVERTKCDQDFTRKICCNGKTY